MGTYRVAQVCLNGHTASRAVDRNPERNERFCSRCGEATIMECLSCLAPLRGEYEVEGVLMIDGGYEPPSFCHACGKPFPWTQMRINAAVELVETADISGQELAQFQRDVEQLTKDSPATVVASVRFKRMMAKVGTSIATGVKEVLVDVLSEAAKKAIWGS